MKRWQWLAIGAGALAMTLTAKKAQAYIAGKPIDVQLEYASDGKLLAAPAAAAFIEMKEAAKRAGILLRLESGFRSMEEQERLWQRYLSGGDLAARPGYSNHQSGIAADISVRRSFSSPEYLWLRDNAGAFGFVNTGRTFSQPEPWHWEFRRSS